jgi:hypothetical protein
MVNEKRDSNEELWVRASTLKKEMKEKQEIVVGSAPSHS